MKKLIFIFVSFLMASCYTPSIILDDMYGTVENTVVSYKKGYKYQIKVWCSEKGKYYRVYSNHLYQVGDIIKIKSI